MYLVALAEAIGCKAGVSKQKKQVLDCLCDSSIDVLTTTDVLTTGLHVVPMNKLNVKVSIFICKEFNLCSVQLQLRAHQSYHYQALARLIVSVIPGVRLRLSKLFACKIHNLGPDASSLNGNCQWVYT